MNTLIMTVGLPQSGKSTWARKQGHPIVSPDAIRPSLHGQAYIQDAEPWVWTIARTMVQSLFAAGHDTVILDATSTTRERRDAWLSDSWGLEFVVFCSRWRTCCARAIADGKPELVDVICRMNDAGDQEGMDPIAMTVAPDWDKGDDSDEGDSIVFWGSLQKEMDAT